MCARATSFIFDTRTDVLVTVSTFLRQKMSRPGVNGFETENVSIWGGLQPPTFKFMPNTIAIWAIRARHLLSHVFEYWLWWHRYFWRKFNWNFNCVRATSFIFDTRTGVLVKVSKSLRQKLSRPEGGGGGPEPPKFGFMPNALTVWAIKFRHLLSHVFEYWIWWYRYFLNKVNIWNVTCVLYEAPNKLYMIRCHSMCNKAS